MKTSKKSKVVVDNVDTLNNLHDALDLIKAVQIRRAPSLVERRNMEKPGVVMTEDFWQRLGEARAALNKAAEMIEKTFGAPVLYAKREIINSTWYLGYRIVGSLKIEVVLHDRDPLDPPETTGEYRVDEADADDDQHKGRTLLGVWLDGTYCTVVNPKHVFSYGEFSKTRHHDHGLRKE